MVFSQVNGYNLAFEICSILAMCQRTQSVARPEKKKKMENPPFKNISNTCCIFSYRRKNSRARNCALRNPILTGFHTVQYKILAVNPKYANVCYFLLFSTQAILQMVTKTQLLFKQLITRDLLEIKLT